MGQAYQNLDLGPRVGWWLRSAYPGARAKQVARRFNVSETTAKRWLAGVQPTGEHLNAMAREWGWRFVQFVYQPLCPEGSYDDRLSADLRSMEARLARLEAKEDEAADQAARAGDDGLPSSPGAMVGEDHDRPVSAGVKAPR